MTLIDVSELADYAGVPPDTPRLPAAVAAAEALVAAVLGTASLTGRAVSVSLRPVRSRRRLELPEGPLTALQALRLDGESVPLAEVRSGPWWVALDRRFAAGVVVEVDYLAGWDLAGGAPAPPEGLRQALLLTAAGLLLRGPDTAKAGERLGDYAVSYRGAAEAVPPAATALLAALRRP